MQRVPDSLLVQIEIEAGEPVDPSSATAQTMFEKCTHCAEIGDKQNVENYLSTRLDYLNVCSNH